jgi:hypothetical protein
MARLLAAICLKAARGWSSRNRRADRGSKSTASEQRHIASASGDQALQVRFPAPVAASARQQDRERARLERRAWRR